MRRPKSRECLLRGKERAAPTVTASMKHLAKPGITREITGRDYGRIYAYDKYLKILNEGTEPLD